MFKIDLTVTISIIIGICAIVSPIITTLLNNRHQMKIKRMELEQEHYHNVFLHNRSIYENYLKYAGQTVILPDDKPVFNYGESYLLALACSPDHLQQKMIHANEKIVAHDWSDALKLFEDLVPDIADIIRIQ